MPGLTSRTCPASLPVPLSGDKMVLGSMAPKPLRCVKAEALLVGKPVDAKLVAAAAAMAVGESSPIDDVRATAWYRQKAGTALMARALAKAAGLES